MGKSYDKPMCIKCGKGKEPQRVGKYSYCLKCQYKFVAESYKRNPYTTFSEERKLRFRCKSQVFQAVKSGALIKKPCEVCGNPKSEGHHEDYDKPLDVKWLCRLHHAEAHNLKKSHQKALKAQISPLSRLAHSVLRNPKA